MRAEVHEICCTTESFYRSEDKMGLISYLGWVVIAELNHLTVFHTGGSHSWVGFIMCHCSWLRLDCQCSVWEWFHGKCEPSVDLSHSPHRDTEIFQLGISRELNSYRTTCQHTWQDMMRLERLQVKAIRKILLAAVLAEREREIKHYFLYSQFRLWSVCCFLPQRY